MKFEGTQSYVATDDLKLAVNAAITLERPLLIKGEPGTGKTMLAEQLAESMGAKLITWHIKSTTKAQHGLYEYDAVSRLRDSQLGEESVKDIRPQWKRIRAEAGLGDFNLHDLRHCVGTWLGRLDKTELVIARTLNHRVHTVTEKYSLIPNEQKEEAITDLADWLQEQVGPPIIISS